MVKITIISALVISLFLVEEDCPFLATLGGRAGICERTFKFKIIFLKMPENSPRISSYISCLLYLRENSTGPLFL